MQAPQPSLHVPNACNFANMPCFCPARPPTRPSHRSFAGPCAAFVPPGRPSDRPSASLPVHKITAHAPGQQSLLGSPDQLKTLSNRCWNPTSISWFKISPSLTLKTNKTKTEHLLCHHLPRRGRVSIDIYCVNLIDKG